MLTLSRADSPITCHLEQREQTKANRWVQHLTRSLRVTAASLPLTLLTVPAPWPGNNRLPAWWRSGTRETGMGSGSAHRLAPSRRHAGPELAARR